VGAHKRPFYKIVVANSCSARDGKFIEVLGSYDPLLKDNKFKIDSEKAKEWISKGAQPTKIMRNIISKL
jgi:small subunit ribosomal protein S16